MSQNITGPGGNDPNTSPTNPASIGRVAGETSPSTRAQGKDGSAPAFQALLEKLEQHAQELRATGEGTLDAERLSGAVDQARETLQDALGLGDRLLEAYRQAMHQNQNTEQGGSK